MNKGSSIPRIIKIERRKAGVTRLMLSNQCRASVADAKCVEQTVSLVLTCLRYVRAADTTVSSTPGP